MKIGTCGYIIENGTYNPINEEIYFDVPEGVHPFNFIKNLFKENHLDYYLVSWFEVKEEE